MRIIHISGARPNFMKIAPVMLRLAKNRGDFEQILVHTGQHYDFEMSEVFFRELRLPEPKYNLGVGSGSHGWQTGKMLAEIESVIVKEIPDWVLAYGDTNSTLAGTLAASKLRVPVAHVEAGLRSFNMQMPEEINRIVTDHVSDLLLCPTQLSMDNLQREGLLEKSHLVGDVMYEAMLQSIQLAEQLSDIFSRLPVEPKRYLLATVHRAENTDDSLRFRAIIKALNSIREPIVFPIHPRAQLALKKYECTLGNHIYALPPVSYFDMLMLQRSARLVITDSGGLQKETYCLGTPCLTLRDETEWIETVETGWNKLVEADHESILQAVNECQVPKEHPQLYGDGSASIDIQGAIEAHAAKH